MVKVTKRKITEQQQPRGDNLKDNVWEHRSPRCLKAPIQKKKREGEKLSTCGERWEFLHRPGYARYLNNWGGGGRREAGRETMEKVCGERAEQWNPKIMY